MSTVCFQNNETYTSMKMLYYATNILSTYVSCKSLKLDKKWMFIALPELGKFAKHAKCKWYYLGYGFSVVLLKKLIIFFVAKYYRSVLVSSKPVGKYTHSYIWKMSLPSVNSVI